MDAFVGDSHKLPEGVWNPEDHLSVMQKQRISSARDSAYALRRKLREGLANLGGRLADIQDELRDLGVSDDDLDPSFRKPETAKTAGVLRANQLLRP